MECPFPFDSLDQCPAIAAHRRGVMAFFHGSSLGENPYRESFLRMFWDLGWTQSRLEAPEDKSPRRESDRPTGD